MACTCLNETCEQILVDGIVICNCTITINDVFCSEGSEIIFRENGNAFCRTTISVEPTIAPKKLPIYFDDEDYFQDVSWTMSFKPNQGWESYFSFYPDYSPSNNNYFQVGYNWAQDTGTLWNHTLNNSSFGVFQNRLEPFIVEYPIANENAFKMLNSISLNVEAKRYNNQWDSAVAKGIGFDKMVIYNNTNNSGILNLIEQKTISDARNYPKTNPNNTQDVLFTPQEGKWNINYFYNRVIDENNNIPHWLKDKNNIFKEINPRAISFRGKRTLERLTGSEFLVRLENSKESRFSIILKNSINSGTIIE